MASQVNAVLTQYSRCIEVRIYMLHYIVSQLNVLLGVLGHCVCVCVCLSSMQVAAVE